MGDGSWTGQDLLPTSGAEIWDSEKAAHKPALPVSGGVLAVIVAGTFLLLRPEPFRPSRPEIAEDAATVEAEEVRARLWEDPFAAVARHRELVKERSNNPHAQRRLNDLFKDDPQALTLQALAVMVGGGPYAEQAERRLRSRYATLSALGVLGYEPEDSEHVGYFRWQLDRDPSKGLDVPYEWFLRTPDGDRLLLLWLDEDAFRSQPLAKIGRLASELDCASPRIKLKLLGPYGSTNLRAMAQELEENRPANDELTQDCQVTHGGHLAAKSSPHETALERLQIYSPSATIAEDLLPGSAHGSLDHRFRVWTGSESSRLLRTIGTDQDLAEVLVTELKRRGVDPGRDSHVALVSEWDTHYGRALPCAFIGAVLGDHYPAWCPESSNGGSETAETAREIGRFHRFSYLRGLDGQLPATPGTESSEEERSTKSKPGDLASVERPVGWRRLDYLRRLAGQLRRLDASLGGKGLEAIGVLGSDVYDKLLVLQALREQFPHVIFFTTDLYASLLHPAEYRSTRNLIVVSNFGLELDRRLQSNVPAFRDNYQTSLYFSTRLALDPELQDPLPGQDSVDRWMEPRIFEVGRSGAFDLSPAVARVTEPQERWRWDSGESIHPPRTDLLSRRLSMEPKKLLVAAVLAAVFFLLYRRTYKDMRPAADQLAARLTRVRAILGLVLLAGMVSLGVLIAVQKPEGEPFALFEGVSVWPSVYLRFFVGAFSLYFMAIGWIAITENDQQLFRQYLLLPGVRRRKSWRTTCRALFRCARLRLRRLRPGPQEAAPLVARRVAARQQAADGGTSGLPLTAAEVLREYGRRSRLARRVLRVLPLWALYFVIGFVVVRIFGEPNVPFRGQISFLASKIVTVAFAVSMLTFLIVWAVDATVLSVWLTKALAGCKMEWPEKTKRYFAERLNLERELLEEWLDIQVIACQSTAVGRLVYYPVIAMILMIASRAPFFDSWDFPVGLCIVVSVSLLYLILCAVALRRAAEFARSVAIKRYRTALIHAAGGDRSSKEDQIRLLLDRIRNLRVGVFVPFSQQPWVRAVALLFGGGGSLVFLEYFVWLH